MKTQANPELAPLFAAVGEALRQNQAALNAADALNGNHGDHMVAVFEIAEQAVQEKQADGLPAAMEYAAAVLDSERGNASAGLYAAGLRRMAEQFRQYNVETADLVGYVQQALAGDARPPDAGAVPQGMAGGTAAGYGDPGDSAAAANVLKALVNGLAAWAESAGPGGSPAPGDPAGAYKLKMGALFEFGMAYLQARQRGGDRVDTLADAAATVSPLSQAPHRYQSARLAIAALLRAIQAA
ncbi:MAG: hypothetical protein ACKOC5_00235 [Chloroflexota bacterium]